MMQETQFIEKQYLGLNKMSIFRRVSLAIFCFIAYYWRENHERSGDLFFLMGIIILCLSLILIFVLHFETKIENRYIILNGLWTTRKIKIDINSLISARRVVYSRFFLNKSVYNLHYKGKIRFFTRGSDAVEIVDKDGQIYLLGSQKADELVRVINHKLKNQ